MHYHRIINHDRLNSLISRMKCERKGSKRCTRRERRRRAGVTGATARRRPRWWRALAPPPSRGAAASSMEPIRREGISGEGIESVAEPAPPRNFPWCLCLRNSYPRFTYSARGGRDSRSGRRDGSAPWRVEGEGGTWAWTLRISLIFFYIKVYDSNTSITKNGERKVTKTLKEKARGTAQENKKNNYVSLRP